jgi:DNA (cytosine-5)-methyltransferase 1
MVWEYLKKINELKPDWFLLENVESLLHPSNKHVVEEIKTFLNEIGYNYIIYKANALDFWVPQKRKRIFVLWSKKIINDYPKPTHWTWKNNNKIWLIPYVNVGKAISEFDVDEFFEKEEVTKLWTYHNDLQKVPPWKNYIALTKAPFWPHPKFVAGKRFWNFLLKLDPNEASWTIAAQPWPWVWPFHRTWRRLRVPEILAIQTFPKWYKLHWNRRSIQKQIWNAVPPLLWKAMISFLINNI